MAQYAVLLYLPAPADPMDTPPEETEAHMRFGKQVEELGGQLLMPQALQSSATATSIRDGLLVDGPFIEAKEVLAGFFVLEARDLDHALQIARLVPTRSPGGVEVRPLFTPPAE